MTDINDLHEPGDDREPEPPEPGVEPVSLDEVAELLRRAENAFSRYEQEKAERDLIEVVVPQMIDEIGDLRLRITEWEALPTREEWAATRDRDARPDLAEGDVWHGDSADEAAAVAKRHGMHLWRQMLSVHPWEPIDDKGPF